MNSKTTYGDYIKIFAFHLPQFHSFPENDLWWGKGFTEWTNLKRVSNQIFVEGNRRYLPHADIGEYNLLDFAARKKQSDIAKQYGVFGFCYHFYWFTGKRLMHEAIDRILIDDQPDIPFMLNWANEPWSRNWDGNSKLVLQEQNYGDTSDWILQFECMNKFFSHRNYFKINNSPIMLIYRIGQIEKFKDMIEVWKKMAKQAGYDDLLVYSVLNYFPDSRYSEKYAEVVDGFVQFEPNYSSFNDIEITKVGNTSCIDIQKAWQSIENSVKVHANHYRGTFPSWDNTPRRLDNGTIFTNYDLNLFKDHLLAMFKKTLVESKYTPTLFFINAWNEWAEGSMLEPTDLENYDRLKLINEVLKMQID